MTEREELHTCDAIYPEEHAEDCKTYVTGISIEEGLAMWGLDDDTEDSQLQ